MKKRVWYIAVFCLLLTLILISNTFALFENNGEAKTEFSIGKWNISLNEYDISNGYNEDILIEDVNYSVSENVEEGYIAPGSSGYFDITLDFNDTSVAIDYDISVAVEKMDCPDNITFTVQNLGLENPVEIDGKLSGVITLDEIKNNKKITLRLFIKWNNDDAFNEKDTEYGIVYDNAFSVPINISIRQHIEE